MDALNDPEFVRFKIEHPVGTKVVGVVVKVAVFGVFLDVGAPWEAQLLLPEIALFRTDRRYPEDYPHVGERLTAKVIGYGDDGRISLSQNEWLGPGQPV